VDHAIERGWLFYRRALFYPDDTPKSFAIAPRLQIARVEVYNVAEAISLAIQLRQRYRDADLLANRLARQAVSTYQLRSGCFATRVYVGGMRHTRPFLRWPQAQMFLALTNLLTTRYERGQALVKPLEYQSA
jgi:hypothetical protein